jgi:rare lipoprotein A
MQLEVVARHRCNEPGRTWSPAVAAWSRRAVMALAVGLPSMLLGACANNERSPSQASWATTTHGNLFPPSKVLVPASPRVVEGAYPVPKGGGVFKLGKPYSVAGRWYVPREEPNYDRSGRGSWYGDDFHGRKTANGEIFDKHALTAAHPTLPLPSYAYVTNLENGRTVLVRINDRGPYSGGRIIDLSHGTAHHLGFEHKGLAEVRVRYAGRAPLNGDDRRERQHLAEQPWFRGTTRHAASMPAHGGVPLATGSLVRR